MEFKCLLNNDNEKKKGNTTLSILCVSIKWNAIFLHINCLHTHLSKCNQIYSILFEQCAITLWQFILTIINALF